MNKEYHKLWSTEEERVELEKLKSQKKEEIEFALIKFQDLKGKEIEEKDYKEIEIFLEKFGIAKNDYFNMILIELDIENREALFKISDVKNQNSKNFFLNKKSILIKLGVLIFIVGLFGFVFTQNTSSFSKKEQEYFKSNFNKIIQNTEEIKEEKKIINSGVMEVYFKVAEGNYKGMKSYIGVTKKNKIYNFIIYMDLMCLEVYTTKIENIFNDYNTKEKIIFTKEEIEILDKYGENLLKVHEEELKNSYSFIFSSINAMKMTDNLYIIEHVGKIDGNDLKNSVIYATTIEKNKDGFVALNKNGVIAKNKNLEELLKNPSIFIVTKEMTDEAKKNWDEFNKTTTDDFDSSNNENIDNEENLNSEVKEFEQTITKFETNDYIMRVDKKYDGYFMSIWEKGTSTSEEPMSLLTNGALYDDGYGNKTIIFITEKNEEFHCLFNSTGEPVSFLYYNIESLGSEGDEPTAEQIVIKYDYSNLN